MIVLLLSNDLAKRSNGMECNISADQGASFTIASTSIAAVQHCALRSTQWGARSGGVLDAGLADGEDVSSCVCVRVCELILN